MKQYILIDRNLLNAQMRSQLKGFVSRNGFYLQDTPDTLAQYNFPDDDKDYVVMSWDADKPSSVLPRYRENGTNDRVNRIFTEQEMRQYIVDNAILDSFIL